MWMACLAAALCWSLAGGRAAAAGHASIGHSSFGHGGFGHGGLGHLGFGHHGFGHLGLGHSGFGHGGLGHGGLGHLGFGHHGFGHLGFGRGEFGHGGLGHLGFGHHGFGHLGFGHGGFGNFGIGLGFGFPSFSYGSPYGYAYPGYYFYGSPYYGGGYSPYGYSPFLYSPYGDTYGTPLFGYYAPPYAYRTFGGSLGYGFSPRYRPARPRAKARPRGGADSLLLEPLGDDRVKLAWVEPDAKIVSVEFFTAKKDRTVVNRLEVHKAPYAVTLPSPPEDGLVGVTVKYADETEVTRRQPLKKMLPPEKLEAIELL